MAEERAVEKVAGGPDGVAEPMSEREASLVSFGHGVREMARVIEEVGRTLEAQNQRSMRLMERLESVARSLEYLPQEVERELEALEAVEQAIEKQREPLKKLGEIPEIVRAVREGNEATRDLWTEATRALSGRLALASVQAEERVRKEHERAERYRGRRFAFAMAVLVLGFAITAAVALVGARSAVREAVLTMLQSNRVAIAEEGERQWRMLRMRKEEEAPSPGPAVSGSLVVEPVGPGALRSLLPQAIPGLSDTFLEAESFGEDDVQAGGPSELVPTLIEPLQ